MSSDVVRRDQGFYISELNRKAGAGRLLRAGYIIFSRTPIIIHLKYKTPFNFIDWFFTNEYIIDLTRVQVCFEHYLKAELLLNGFVVHKPKNSARELFDKLKDRKTKLVSIEDMLKYLSFVYDDVKGHNSIPQLAEQTLGFGEMIKLEAIHKIPENVIEILKYNNKIRNTLHFSEAEPQAFNASTLIEVINFVDVVIPQRINELADELNLPNLRL